MTRQEWLDSSDVRLMLRHINSKTSNKTSNRKHRLFTIACAKQVLHLTTNELVHYAITIAEKYADKKVTKDELKRTYDSVMRIPISKTNNTNNTAIIAARTATNNITNTSAFSIAWNGAVIAASGISWSVTGNGTQAWAATMTTLAHTLRDIIGNSYEPITCPKPSTIIASLAQAAYEDQDTITGHLNPIRLNILADALEEANYPPEFTTHLHSPNHHVRGCWVLDLIMGKK